MLPNEVKILGHDYKVVLVENFMAQTGGNAGQVNNYLNVIQIAKELPLSSQLEILLHEILEVLDYRLELGLEHNKLSILSETLYQVLRDNKLKF